MYDQPSPSSYNLEQNRAIAYPCLKRPGRTPRSTSAPRPPQLPHGRTAHPNLSIPNRRATPQLRPTPRGGVTSGMVTEISFDLLPGLDFRMKTAALTSDVIQHPSHINAYTRTPFCPTRLRVRARHPKPIDSVKEAGGDNALVSATASTPYVT